MFGPGRLSTIVGYEEKCVTEAWTAGDESSEHVGIQHGAILNAECRVEQDARARCTAADQYRKQMPQPWCEQA